MSDRYKPGLILARKDQANNMYGPGNCYWRDPRIDTERKFGIEDSSTVDGEPDDIELTAQEKVKRAALKDVRYLAETQLASSERQTLNSDSLAIHAKNCVRDISHLAWLHILQHGTVLAIV